MMDEILRMLELAGQGFHCSQILLFMGLEAQKKHNPDLIRSMAGLAGGVGFCGEVCGALTGGACLIALYGGRGTPEEEDHPKLNLMISELVDWFSQGYGQRFGSMNCRDIVEDDPGKQAVRCPEIVGGTYEKVKSLLLENGIDLSEGR
jgi:C_GCAxxG_C_C family probable redox protein